MRCSEIYTTCVEDQFPDMASELADTVTQYIRLYGSDRVAVVFLGFELSEFVEEAAANHPILRTVQWMGSDADILQTKLVVSGSAINEFLTDVNFRASSFSGSEDTVRYNSLAERLSIEFPGETPSVYAYSSYDAVWAVGLAMEAAGGPNSSFADIEAQIGPAVDNNDEGALGDITLNMYGDIESGDYAVWGIESTGWERISTYRSDGTLTMLYEEPDVITIGALLSLGGANGVPPSMPTFLDDEMAVSMALSRIDFNNSNPDMEVEIRTIDTSLGSLSALRGLHSGTCDSANEPLLIQLINNAAAVYDAEGSFDSLNGAHMNRPISSFAFDSEGKLAFVGADPNLSGMNVDSLSISADRTVEQIFGLLMPQDDDSWQPPSYIWSQSKAFNPALNVSFNVRVLMTYHTDSGLILSAFYPIVTPCDDAAPITSFVGPTTSSSLTAVSDYINDGGYVAVSPSSTSTTLSQDDGIFRLSPNNGFQVPTIAGLVESVSYTHLTLPTKRIV